MTTAGGYYWIREIAKGGMGRVDLLVRAEGTFRRLCAVKRLHGVLLEEPDCRAMFLDEARIAGLLEHPNVIRVFDVGEDTDGPHLMMDFVDGTTVRGLIQHALHRGAALPLTVAVEVAIQAARGLHAAHELRAPDGTPLELVHRDVSPLNIMVGHDGIVRVMDFGIARTLGRTSRTSTGVIKGKVGYMSPEQLQYRPPDRRSDLFALGVVLYEMLTSTRLYSNKDGTGPRRILDEPPPDVGLEREGLPAPLVELVFQLLAKDREKRPGTAMEVAQRLGDVLAELVFSDETAVELRVFMSLEFAEEATRHRAEVNAALGRLDRGQLPPWPLPNDALSLGTLAHADHSVAADPPWPRWLLGAALIALVVGALGAGVYIGRGPESLESLESVTDAAPSNGARGPSVVEDPFDGGLGAEPAREAREAELARETEQGQQGALPDQADDAVNDGTASAAIPEAPPDAPTRGPSKRRRRQPRRNPPSAVEEPPAPATPRDPLAPAAFGSIGGEPR